MSTEFVVWEYTNIDGMVSLDRLHEVKDSQDLLYGRSVAQRWPDNAYMAFHPDRPRDTRTTDCLMNTDSLIVASAKLKGVLEANDVKGVEYLPVAIHDHKGKPLATPYFLVNTVGLVDCLDAAASGARVDAMDPDTFSKLKKMVLFEDKVPADLKLFRLSQYPGPFLVRKSLAAAIDAAGIVGPRWTDPASRSFIG